MNIAYIDGQNLRMGTNVNPANPWKVDLYRFRDYLRRKFDIQEAYYFLGAYKQSEQTLYDNLQKAGFILVFREHTASLKSDKKGNIDVDLTFYVMRDYKDRPEAYNRVFIVSGDGDYFRLVEYLVEKERFGRMIFPNRKYASSLYRNLGAAHQLWLDDEGIKRKIEMK